MASWLGAGRVSAGGRSVIQAHEMFQHARRCVQSSKDRMKARYDQKASVHLYAPGDQVWLHTRHLALRHPAMRDKLLPRFWGPISVLRLVGNNAVQLALPASLKNIHDVVSVSIIKPCKVRADGELPPCNIDGSVEYEVDQIINHNTVISRSRKLSSIVEFRVRRKGSYDDTWHEPQDFKHSIETLCAYLNSLNPSMRKRVLKLFDAETLSALPSYMRAQAS